jgi:hypothetical protein
VHVQSRCLPNVERNGCCSERLSVLSSFGKKIVSVLAKIRESKTATRIRPSWPPVRPHAGTCSSLGKNYVSCLTVMHVRDSVHCQVSV